MSVVVDSRPLAAEALGLRTVGQLLAHLQRDNRLVVHVLIDGREPDFNQMGTVRREQLLGHELFIETADPHQLALEAIDSVTQQLAEADRLKAESIELLHKNLNGRAMEKLSGCFGTWQHAQESVLKTAQLMRVDLNELAVDGVALPELLSQFTGHLRDIKSALENRDFVLLCDILVYEVSRVGEQWQSALKVLRDRIEAAV